MTEEEALERLTRMVAADVAPTLDSGDLAALLSDAALPDSAGVQPADDGWVPTYNLNLAAAEGWEIKAGRAVAYDFTAHGQTFDRSQVQKQCEARAERYRKLARRRGGFVAVTLESTYSGDSTDDDE